tara:strand:+ start:139 stop:516 length:378 start_codon:yes stop_codon:yes gene_type:complete
MSKFKRYLREAIGDVFGGISQRNQPTISGKDIFRQTEKLIPNPVSIDDVNGCILLFGGEQIGIDEDCMAALGMCSSNGLEWYPCKGEIGGSCGWWYHPQCMNNPDCDVWTPIGCDDGGGHQFARM